jgi:cytochrome d ubiquinol oxidase subunit II
MPALEELLAAVIIIALSLYVLLGGADFGGGVWDLLASGPRKQAQRALIADAIGPIWEANHVWLILVIVLLFADFPLAFTAIMTALFTPITLMLIGIVLRGATFVFRSYDKQTDDVQRRWGSIFAIASIVTPIMIGVCVGALASGRIAVTDGLVTSTTRATWLAPFPLAIGLFTLLLFAYLAAVYLTVEADDPALRADFRQRALITTFLVEGVEVVVLLLMGSGAPLLLDGLTRSTWALPLHTLALLAFVGGVWALWTWRFYLARLLAIVQVIGIIWGWGAAQYPYLIEPSVTIYNAAAPPIALRLTLIALAAGSLLLFPAIYFMLRIFKGRRISSLFGGSLSALMDQMDHK